ncbi:MAG TPA: DNA polymerase III subunit beta [Pyrinomonadaceae bacterium]|nr:DNA polymerase III subunit beta [Pyrinomonadaceae bacterium]
MEAIIHAKQLKEQVGALQGIFAKKETIPALGKIKIDANSNGAFVMTATDLDISLIIEQEVDILQSGSICLSGKKLGEMTAGLPNEPVHLKLDSKGERVEFRAGRFKSKLSGTDSDTFPEVPRVNAESLKLSATVFYEGLRRTIFGATDDNKRFTINGILLILDDSGLKMVSTDGHRLCLFQTAASQTNQTLTCLIPIKAARELKNLLASEIRSNQKVELKIKKGSQLEFEIGNKLMTAREISGNFPNWEMVVPKTFEYFAETKANELKDALTRVGVMADDAHRRIEFSFNQNKLTLKSESAETGASSEEINCTFQKLGNTENVSPETSDDWKIAFNTKYLMEFLALQNAKQNESRVIWKFGSNVSQTLLTFEGEERLFSYVIVPLK